MGLCESAGPQSARRWDERKRRFLSGLTVTPETNEIQDHSKSSLALKEAAYDFPSVVPLLADKLDVSLPANLRAHRDFRIETDAQYVTSQSLIVLPFLIVVQVAFCPSRNTSFTFTSLRSAFLSHLERACVVVLLHNYRGVLSLTILTSRHRQAESISITIREYQPPLLDISTHHGVGDIL